MEEPSDSMVFDEVKKLRRQVDELTRQREFYKTMMDISCDRESWVDPSGRIIYMSPSAEQITGYRAEQFIKDPDLMLRCIHPDDREKIDQSHTEYWCGTRQLEALDIQFRLVTKDGDIRHIHRICKPVFSADGEYLGRRISDRDITDQVLAALEYKAEKEFTEKLLETAQMIVLVLDVEGKIVRFNPYLEKLTGYTLEDMKGEDWFSYFLPEANRDLVREVFKKSVNNIHTRGSQNEILTRSGKRLVIEWYDDTLCDKAGKVVGLLAIGIDVTERLQDQKRLKNSEERYALAVQGSNDGIWDWDMKTDVVYLSPRWKAMVGYGEEELENTFTTFETLMHPDDKERVRNTVEQYLSGNVDVYEVEFRYRHKNGSWRWILARGEALRDEKGIPYRMAGSHTDITQRKNAEEHLAAQSLFLQTLMESMPIPIFYKDKDVRYLGCNRKFEEFMCVKREEILGKKVCEIWPNASELIGYQREELALLKQHGTQQYNHNVTTSSGEQRQVILYRSTFEKEHGEVEGLIGAMLDVTENFRNQHALEKAKKDLESANRALQESMEQAQEMAIEADRANKAKSEFLANMSHEIRTPLNVIIGFADLLESAIKDVRQREQAEIIATSGKSLLRLINDILDLSKVEAGKLSIEHAVFEPSRLIHETVAIFSSVAAQKGLKLDVKIDEEMPMYALSDASRLRQILLNLVGNAIKYTETGRIVVGAHCKITGDEQFDLTVDVKDTGIGISPDFRPYMFEAFEQPTEQNHAQYGGTGLGLAISRKLAAMLGGTLTYVPRETGTGSLFSLSIERIPILYDGASARTDHSLLHQRIIFTGHPVLLVVDDVSTNRRLLESYLESQNCHIMEAADGREAMDLLQKTKIDIVLTDIKMPVMDGRELLHALRTHTDKALREIPVIAITASGMMQQNIEDEKLFDAFLVKPVNQNELLQEMSRFLKHSTQSDPQEGMVPEKGLPIQEPLQKRLCVDPAKLSELFTSVFLHDIDSLSKQRNLNLANEAGCRLERFGVEENEPVLVELGQGLQHAAESFDTELLTQSLNALREIIQTFRIEKGIQQ